MKNEEKNNQNGNINNYLVEAFQRLNKKQSEIIKDLGKPQSYVSALMNGKKKVGKEVAKQLHELYGFDEGGILTGETIHNSEVVTPKQYSIRDEELILVRERLSLYEEKIDFYKEKIEQLEEENERLKKVNKSSLPGERVPTTK